MYYQRKIAFHTLGCKLNFSETSSVARVMEDVGYLRVDFSEIADVYVINTCSVTENADKECAYIVRQIQRRAPDAKVVIMGCYAQLKPQEIASIPGVNMVLGAAEKFNLQEHIVKLETAQEEALVLSADIKDVNTFTAAFSAGDRTRTFLKVQDGCDYFCTFCTIPLARGRSRSQSIAETLEAAKKAAETGVKEIVLTGVNTGDFGKTSDGRKRTDENLFQLVQELEKIEGVERWRISSIEPNLLTEEIIDFVSTSTKFAPHFHIPLQSGNDEVLSWMHRKYDSSLYRRKIEYIRKKIPHAGIGVDVIVGFPGETDAHFEDTYQFIQSLDVSYLHVFTYSERLNTRAIKIEPVVPIEMRRERNKRLRILSEKKRHAFYSAFENTIRTVLFEHENNDGFMYGYTDNYIRVRAPFDETFVNQLIPCEIGAADGAGYCAATRVVHNTILV